MMSRHSIVMAIGAAVLAGGCGAAAQANAKTQVAGVQCSGLQDVDRQVAALYAPGNVQHVEPTYRTEFLARAIQPRYVSGAKLHVPAQQGMTQGYLERVLTCHAAAQNALHPNDPLLAQNVRDVDVQTRGQRFVIQIEGADRASGKEILQRARALQDSATRVEVRQLSDATSAPSRM